MKQIRHFLLTAGIVAILTVGLGYWLQRVLDRMPLTQSVGGESVYVSRQGFYIGSLLSQHFWAIAFLFAE